MVNTIDNLDPARWISTRSPAFSVRDWLARHWPQRAPVTPYDELAELDAHTLADIGAPDHLLDRAMVRREVRRQERGGLALGLASGAWQHW